MPPSLGALVNVATDPRAVGATRSPFLSRRRVFAELPGMGKGGIRVGGGSNPSSPSRPLSRASTGSVGGGSPDLFASDGEAPVSGMWIGESWPSPELLAVDPTIPTNPIRWSLTLDPSAGPGGISAFGAGCFDDSADIPGTTHLWFTLRGTFNPETRDVQFDKVYERPAPAGEVVRYKGKLHSLNGPKEITGTWENTQHGTAGTFSCMMKGSGGGGATP